MQILYYERVQDTTTTTGTGTYTLDATAPAGFRSFDATVTNGAGVMYTVTDGTDWEVCYGVFNSTGTGTLPRTTILASSNAGAAVNWAAGSKTVILVHPAVAVNAVATDPALVWSLAGANRVPEVSAGAAIAAGPNSSATSTNAVAYGSNADATGAQSCAVGHDAAASGTAAVAVGAATASAQSAVAVNGTASGQYSVALGGNGSTAAGHASTVTGGEGCSTATNNTGYASRAGGFYANARFAFADAFGFGTGTSQRIAAGQYKTTTDATPTKLELGAAVGTYGRIKFAADITAGFTGTVIGRAADGTSKFVEVKGLVKFDGSNNPTLIGSSATVLFEDAGAAAWAVSVSVDTSNDCIDINVTGAAATTITWSSDLRFHEHA